MQTNLVKFLSLPVLSTVFLISSLFIANQHATAQTSPPFSVDRWDPWWTDREMWGTGMKTPEQRQRIVRHWSFMYTDLPQKYRGERNPLPSDSETVKAGRTLYQQHCSECHGPKGLGNGELANSLNPSPALLAYMIQMPMAVDEYLLWSISEGGQPFGTDMPAFKAKISKDTIWKVISYMRAGFPSSTKTH